MSIKDRVEDAKVLLDGGRYVGAFANLLVAISASSRKAFPKKVTKSNFQKGTMQDAEAFNYFLGGRLHKLLLNPLAQSDYGSSGICIEFEGEQQQIENIIYTHFRCSLIHEGRLLDNVDFVDSDSNLGGTPTASVSQGGRLLLGTGWINLAFQAVVYAQINGDEFGIEHRYMKPKFNIDEVAFANRLTLVYDMTPGRIEIFKDAIIRMARTHIDKASFDEVALLFNGLVSRGEISLGSLNGLQAKDLVDNQYRLTPKGGKVIQDIAREYEIVVV
ncbi:hypothetical protein KMT30_41820 [Streptomyces sp. IBSBF 2953]|jgi:hypothetical protein|nr:hypothetical protein [Streptomyces hayashii]